MKNRGIQPIWMIIALMVILSAVNCSANPLLLCPTGTTLTTGQFRAEAALSPSNKHGNYTWLAAGLNQFEACLIRMSGVEGEDANSFCAQWCFLPETFFTPAVSLGVTDIGAQTEDGVGVYAAATKSIPTGKILPVIKDFSATLGIGVGGIKGLFAGLQVKLPAGLFIQGEYDTQDFNGAVGWQIAPALRVKVYSIRKETYFGAEIVPILF